MGEYNAALTVLILLTGLTLTVCLHLGEHMEKFTQAVTRLNASVKKSNDKIDLLLAGQQVAVDAAVEAALSSGADQLNAASDLLESKNG